MAHRNGFVIPNAGDQVNGGNLPSNRQAEPDAGDFSVLGNDRYGVLLGYDYTVSSGNFSLNTSGGVNVGVINGTIVTTANGNIGLQAGGSAPRFDLVGVDSNGLRVIRGVDSDAPTFPEIPSGFLVLGAIYVPAGAATNSLTTSNVVDKRVQLLSGARGASASGDVFLENKIDGTTSSFKVLGSGATTIGDVTLTPTGGNLVISGGDVSIQEDADIQGDLVVDGNVTVDGRLTGANLISASIPGTPNVAAEKGSLFQDRNNGRLWIKRGPLDSDWGEIYPDDEYPPGTIIATMLTGSAASSYLSGGWLHMNGQKVPVGSYARLAGLFTQWVVDGGTNLQLPDLSGRFLMGADTVGETGGQSMTTLTTNHLPSHKHFGSATETGAAGSHNHGSVIANPAGAHNHQITSSGVHRHGIDDPGHRHEGANHGFDVPSYFIHARWGGGSKLDSQYADSSHTWTVDVTMDTVYAQTGITGTRTDGAHTHAVQQAEDHTHTINIPTQAAHTHSLPTESSVGGNTPFENRPPYFTVNYYIKA